MQEPASAVASALNLAAHIYMQSRSNLFYFQHNI